MNYSNDALATLLLCTRLGLPPDPDAKPLTLREWNDLAGRVLDSAYGVPGALLGQSGEALAQELRLRDWHAKRLSVLLSRGGDLAIELDRLESLGIWFLTRADDEYPVVLKKRMKHGAPVVLFGAGDAALLGQPGLAVVGSRNVDAQGQECARFVGNACGVEGLVLYSGAARGVDQLAMQSAIERRGFAVGMLANSLEKAIRDRSTRKHLLSGNLALATPYSPDAGFSVSAAMGRNRLIYALAEYALVVASDAGKGGTWAGATRALKDGWAPVYVLMGPDVPEGNRKLADLGAIPFPVILLDSDLDLRTWLETHRPPQSPPLVQGQLFA